MLLPRLANNGVSELRLNKLQEEMKAQVNAKIQKKHYVFEKTNCAVCNSAETVLVGEKDRYGFYYSVQLCADCGLLYTSPRMTQESYNEFYNIEYRKLYSGRKEADMKFVDQQYARAHDVYDFLKDNGSIKQKGLKVLEVGCGAGGILKYFKDQGHSVKGIDIGAEYINYGKTEYGLDLEVSMLSDLNIDYKPDIIIYSHVIEHILELDKELEVLHKFCHENTAVYMEVPGLKSIHQHYERNILTYFQNAHTFHFSLKSLENLFKKNGFELIAGTEFVRSIFKAGKPSNNFENDFDAAKEYLIHQEKYRFLYPISPKGIRKNSHATILRVLDALGLRKPLKKLLGSK